MARHLPNSIGPSPCLVTTCRQDDIASVSGMLERLLRAAQIRSRQQPIRPPRSRSMTILGRSVRSSESRGLLARIARSQRRHSGSQPASAELAGMIALVPAVDFAALRDLIDGNPRR
jgi:hypothetical protein